ncbi:MAG: DMT family transporter [Alphaproteobacteria bacterium]
MNKAGQFSNHDGFSYVLLCFATCFWASVFVVGKDVLGALSPLAASSIRFLIAATIFTFILGIAFPKAFTLRNLKYSIIPAITGVFAYNMAFFYGLDYSYASHAVIIIPGMGPAVTAILSFLLLKERLEKKRILGIIVAFTGLVVLEAGSLDFDKNWQTILIGDAIYLSCTVMWSLYTLYLKKIMQQEDLNPMEITGVSTILGTIILAGTSFMLAPTIIDELRAINVTSWMKLLFIGVVGTNLPFLFWTIAVKKIGAIRASIFLNMVPLWGVVMAYFYLSEPMTIFMPLSLVIILCGVWLTQRSGKPLFKADH